MADNNLKIVIDDGFKRIPIENIHGEQIGTFYFNPTDVGIIDRFNKVAKEFNQITEPMEKAAPENATEEEKIEFDVATKREATERLYAACNELFGGDFASAFFGTTDPWSPVNGDFYCYTAISMIGDFISRQFDEEVEKMNERTQKYTNRAQRRAAKKK